MIGQTMALRRRRVGLSSGTLAELARVSVFSLSRFEHGTITRGPRFIGRLDAVLSAYEAAREAAIERVQALQAS